LHQASVHPNESGGRGLRVAEVSGDYAASTPLPGPGEVDDVANAAVFLLGDTPRRRVWLN
jgi:hypothetical protein